MGDERLGGGPLTRAVPREMSEEAAGGQTSRCALKKPRRLAGAYPNLCRRQISPGSLRRPQGSSAITEARCRADVNLGFCESETPERKAGHQHIHQGPVENKYLGLERGKERMRNGCKTGSLMFASLCLWNITSSPHYFFSLENVACREIGGICSSAKVKTRIAKVMSFPF